MMKQFLVGVSILACSIILPQAVIFAENLPANQRESTTNLAPTTLITMAYRGNFSNQNIPGYLGFLQEYILGRINSEKLVQAAINERLLPASTIDDRHYLNAVRNQLESQLPIY